MTQRLTIDGANAGRGTGEQATKIDLYKERRAFFNARRRPELVDLGEASFLVVEGEGAPESAAFTEKISALYSVAYTLKFNKKRGGTDFRVPTFEGMWWSGDEETASIEAFGASSRENWRWRLLMMVPDAVTQEDFETARRQVATSKPECAAVRLERRRLGRCVQMLHLGPYATEHETMQQIHDFMDEHGLKASRPHHEVYLGDPRRAQPDKLKTILRQPVQDA